MMPNKISRFPAAVALVAVLMVATGSVVHPPAAAAKRTIIVRMVGDASGFHFRPANVSAHVGDIVRFVNVSGGPHNVVFWEDSIPSGTAEKLQNNMQKTTDRLTGPLLTEPKETYTVSLAGLRAGTYRYYCFPHLVMKMVGRITVRP